MNYEFDLLGDLREKFIFLTFMTDQEVEHLLSVVASVARGTSIHPDEILNQIEKESSKSIASC